MENQSPMNNEWKSKFDLIIRDVSSVGFMAKSELRKKFGDIIFAERRKVKQEIDQRAELLCQWLNENKITDPNLKVNSQQIKKWLHLL